MAIQSFNDKNRNAVHRARSLCNRGGRQFEILPAGSPANQQALKVLGTLVPFFREKATWLEDGLICASSST